MISIGYFAAVAPLFRVGSGVALSPWTWYSLQYVIAPTAIGIALAYAHQYRLLYRVAGWIGLRFAHHLPAAWDYAFDSLPDTTYILVTLADGTQIAGRWAEGSFAASSSEERDLLIAELWEAPGGIAPWHQVIPARSVLICGKDIRLIEFF